MDTVFADHHKKYVIYPLTVKEITQTRSEDATLKKLTMKDKYSTLLLEDIKLLSKVGKMVITMVLQNQTVS
jgi:hypothetical protein